MSDEKKKPAQEQQPKPEPRPKPPPTKKPDKIIKSIDNPPKPS